MIGHLGCFLVKSDFEIREFSYNFKFEISAIAISVNPGCPEVVSKVCHLLSRYEIRQCIIRCIALLYAFVGAGYASQYFVLYPYRSGRRVVPEYGVLHIAGSSRVHLAGNERRADAV